MAGALTATRRRGRRGGRGARRRPGPTTRRPQPNTRGARRGFMRVAPRSAAKNHREQMRQSIRCGSRARVSERTGRLRDGPTPPGRRQAECPTIPGQVLRTQVLPCPDLSTHYQAYALITSPTPSLPALPPHYQPYPLITRPTHSLPALPAARGPARRGPRRTTARPAASGARPRTPAPPIRAPRIRGSAAPRCAWPAYERRTGATPGADRAMAVSMAVRAVAAACHTVPASREAHGATRCRSLPVPRSSSGPRGPARPRAGTASSGR